MTESMQAPSAPSEPLFVLDLGKNGGKLAPTTPEDLIAWLEKERNYWAWISGTQAGNHRSAIDVCIQPIAHAISSVQQAIPYITSNPDHFMSQISAAQTHIRDTYLTKQFPHSTTPLAKRTEKIRQENALAAIAYLYARLRNSAYQFDARDIDSWRGFVEGLAEQFQLTLIPDRSVKAALASVDDLRVKTEAFADTKSQEIDALHRRYDDLVSNLTKIEKDGRENFENALTEIQATHNDAMASHVDAMKTLETTFREKMALRSPVEYWENRRRLHSKRSNLLRVWSFLSMLLLAIVVGLVAHWVSDTVTDGKPEAWRVAVLGIVGVLGIWAVRLVVRMFLSDSHLATDASERVTMVQTYLSLLEEGKLLSDDDRKLILQALFRPVSDGLVKDEGLPHPILEALTKIGSR